LFAVAVASTVAACSREVPKEETYLRNGLVCELGKDKPFSGYVVGKAREGYRSKRLKFKKQYKDGLLNGETRFWYDNGNLESIEPYRNGKINGMVTRYYENGQIKTYIHLVDGMRGGYKGEMFWSDDGRKKK
jgi:antitoxin component YwqK of YwqJK toxin-antitoxin module